MALKCPHCGHKSKAPQGNAAHQRWCEKNPNRPALKRSSVEVVRSPRRTARDLDELLLVVQLAFPKGIQTGDPDVLRSDLRWIAQTHEIMSRR